MDGAKSSEYLNAVEFTCSVRTSRGVFETKTPDLPTLIEFWNAHAKRLGLDGLTLNKYQSDG